MSDAQRGWAWASDTGDTSHILSTDDGGATWTDRSPTGYTPDRAGASFADADHAWLPARSVDSNQPALLRTADGGRTWLPALAPAGYAAYQRYGESAGVAASFENGDAGNFDVRFYETQDGGMTWNALALRSPMPGPPAGTVYICRVCGDTASFFPPSHAVITYGDTGSDTRGFGQLKVSQDGGRAWNEVKLEVPFAEYADARVTPLAPVFFDQKQWLVPAFIFKLGDGPDYAYSLLALYTTNDGGLTWTTGAGVAEDVSDEQSERKVLSASEVIVRCGRNLCVTQDAGQTWTTISPNIDLGTGGNDRRLLQLDFIDLKTGWALLHSDDGTLGLYGTTDGGHTWNLLSR